MDINYLTIDEIRVIQIKILDSVDAFCQKNGLRYSLGGGTLLGAIRHNGFIPWDDDVDIMMPRADYEFFVKNYNNSEFAIEKECRNFENCKGYFYPFAKVCDLTTALIEENHNQELGINIDLFPIDGVPEKWKLYIFKLKVLRYLLFAHIKISNQNLIKRMLVFVVRRIISVDWVQKKMKALCLSNDFAKAQYRGAVIGVYGEKEIYKKYVFEGYEKHVFQDKEYFCIKEYDVYLRQHYGKYMELPSESERVNPHFIKAYKIREEHNITINKKTIL